MFERKEDPDFAKLDQGLKENIGLSIKEGSLSTIMGTLIGGAYLTGFALVLGANDFIIGILASLPLLANLVQIIGSYIISRIGSSKRVCVIYVLLHRILWILILIMPFFVFSGSLGDIRIWLFITLIGFSSIFSSISSVSWMTWMSELIPKDIRGRFFAKRDMAARVVGMLFAVGAGLFIDIWKNNFIDNNLMQSYGFTILFAVGTLAGFLSVTLLRRMSEPDNGVEDNTEGFIKQLALPLQDKSFRSFIIFSVVWGFSVGIASPFFSVYMIKTLSIPFSIISLFGVASGIAAIFGMRLWGRIIDSFGPKPLYIICGIGGAFVPFLWIFATPENYFIIWVLNVLSGICWAGIGLAAGNITMNLAPTKYNSVFFAVFAAITGISGALAPIFGGFLGVLFRNASLNLGFLTLSNLRLLFLTSGLLRLVSLLFLRSVEIKENASVQEMLKAFTAWHKYTPVNRRISITGYTGYFTSFMNRGVINLERRVERMAKANHRIKNGMSRRIHSSVGFLEEIFDRFLDIFWPRDKSEHKDRDN